jgi:glycine/D-amino acid oxidase-like deaminating enzyme/nitrite reductase/ring-hydroxylating ferredoxin subunit
MNAAAERSVSYWRRTADLPEAVPLTSDRKAEVAVIGAGIAGLSTAFQLAKHGRSVVVLDRGAIGGGMSSRTTAHLASALDDYYYELIRARGLEEARQYYASQAAAIARIETICQDEAIACDFARVDGYLFLAPESEPALLERELEALHAVGFNDVSWADRAPVPGIDTGRCLRFPGQARFQPLKYLRGLVNSIQRAGGQLFAHSPVEAIEEGKDGVTVRTIGGACVRAGSCVVATNSPINNRVAIHTKQAPYRTYVIGATVPHGSVHDALCWDTLDPYHYVRLQPGGANGADVIIIGGEDHKTGEADDPERRFAALEAWARRHFPPLQEVTDRWSGQVMEPVDYLPYAGRNPGDANIYIATGDSGQGMTNGVAASLLICDLILGRDNAWAKACDPRRVTVRAVGEFLRENIDVAARFAEHVTAGELSSFADLQNGQGGVIRAGTRKLAAYRDDQGQLHVRSATCTHAGCIVHWNTLERCWDCPCHGSHFAIDGTPLNGPAIAQLTAVDPEEARH